MATTLETSFSSTNTDSNFQDFCTRVNTNLLAFGWLAAADTDQINPATVVHPAANSDAGYLIYKTGDGLTIFYVKLLFGNDSNNHPRIKVTVSTGTDGAGTPSGNVSTTFTANALGMSSAQLAMAGANNRMTIVMGTISNGANNAGWGFSLGRTVDTAGAVNDNGMEFFGRGNDSNTQQFVPKVGNGSVPSAENNGWRAPFTNAATAVIGSYVRYGFPVTWGESLTNNPTLCVMVYSKNDFAPGAASTKTLSVYGSNHAYLLDHNEGNAVQGIGGSGFTRGAWRYE